jgi:hypothetical protein
MMVIVMTNNAEREGFEQWWIDRKGQGYVSFKRDKHGEYVAEFVRDAWDSWQGRAQASGVPIRHKIAPIEPTTEMIEAGAQRLVSWEDNCVWPNSWSALQVAAARNEAERVWRSMWLCAEAAPTPPKFASVPVERLESLQRYPHGIQDIILSDDLDELIKEYK